MRLICRREARRENGLFSFLPDMSEGLGALLLNQLGDIDEKEEEEEDDDDDALSKEEVFSFLSVGRSLANILQQMALLEKVEVQNLKEIEELMLMAKDIDDVVELERKFFHEMEEEEEEEEEEDDGDDGAG